MSTDLDLCLKHLKSLVGFDTSNPPRKIKESGLIAYLNSLDFVDPQIKDHGSGSFNIFFTDSSTVPIPYVPNLGLLLLSKENFDFNSNVKTCLVD